MHNLSRGLLLAGGLLVCASPVAAQLPQWQEAPLYDAVTVVSGFPDDPRQAAIWAGGPDEAPASLGRECKGMINMKRPDIDLYYREAGDYSLYLYVLSLADTSLVVYTPDYKWLCSDDALGLHPMVSIDTPKSGNYNIWVGSYGGVAPATLYISEIDPRD